MFCDKTQITIKPGTGGNGRTGSRKLKYNPKAGPDGGDGGKGGDFIFKTNENLNSLIELHTKKKFKAEDGEDGGSNCMHGKNGEDFVLEVPVGTKITDLKTGEVFDLNDKNMKFVFAKGGRGGYGNAHFVSSIRRYPDFSELGEPVYSYDLEVELMLVADIGIIGLPSAGKSTLINKVSNVKAKTADYHFTTLVPNIGIAKVYGETLVLTDIPGLIEGASDGKGLGFEFLRHISRNSALIHVLDGNSMDIVKDYQIIQNELKKYSEDLAEKKQIIAINKADLLDDNSKTFLKDYFLQENKNAEDVIFISAITGEGVDELMGKALNLIQDLKSKKQKIEEKPQNEDGFIEYKPHLEINPRDFTITDLGKYSDFRKKRLENGENNVSVFGYSDNLEDDEREFIDEKTEEEGEIDARRIWQIDGPRIVQIAKMTNFDQRGGLARLYDVLEKMHIQQKLENKWEAEDGDILKFGDWEKCLVFRR
ncbi:GTPase ObgE [Candidatus Gracilibacteria bacterium]|nr:GTPase ObgE [Candidatus Gracilibacteria bacterium]